MAIDLRECLNAISDVVNNRPKPLREFDQIYMKVADMLLQTEHVGRCLDARRVVFIGDGDAIGLCLVHLHKQKLLESGPESVHILDFDERVVVSIRGFAERFGISQRVTAELYNVADTLPKQHWESFGGFYTNPPFGARNGGRSIEAFVTRGIEAVGSDAVGCLVVADHEDYPWTQQVLWQTEALLLKEGFAIAELLPKFHHYHLDDAPDLTSCSMTIRRIRHSPSEYRSQPLGGEMLANFYGEEAPLRVRYVRDATNGGRVPSSDHRLEPFHTDGESHEPG